MRSAVTSSTRLLLALALLLPAASTLAEPLEADEAITLRQAAYHLQGHYFSQLKAMATGKQAFDAAKAQQMIVRVQALSQMTPEFFPPGSDRGKTKAKPEVWTQAKDFAARHQQSNTDLALLAAAIKTGKPDVLKSAYLQAAGSCKDCHETYRAR